MTEPRRWIADGPVSHPTPTKHDVKVPMGGFCMTPDGLQFDLTDGDVEEFLLTEANDG